MSKKCPINENKRVTYQYCEDCEYKEDCRTNPDKMRAIAILMDIGSRYGDYKYEDGKYIIHTNGGAKMIYRTPEEGCWDWLDYMIMVNEDTPNSWSQSDITFIKIQPKSDAVKARECFARILKTLHSDYRYDEQGRFIVYYNRNAGPKYIAVLPDDPEWPGDIYETAEDGCIAFLPFLRKWQNCSAEIVFVEKLAAQKTAERK